MQIINPATGEAIRELKEDTAETAREKVARARAAQPAWAATPYAERAKAIDTFKRLITEREDELARVQSEETGKPVKQALGELRALEERLDFFLKHTEAAMRPESVVRPDAPVQERIAYEPLGVVVNISAWNYPWFVGTNVYVPALLTGNTVLYKPSEFATLTGLKMAELLHESGIPGDAFITVVGGGGVGAALIDSAVDGVYFTGSNATGRKIAEAAGRRLIRTQLELGGKDPAYVCEDVDVKSAAEGLADGAFYNTGQSCCSVERIYVHERIYDEFVAHFVATVKGFPAGDPSREDTYIGPLTREPQLTVLEEQVSDAAEKGAKLETGGKRMEGPGYYFEPTVFSNVSHEMKLMRDESFGPVIGIQKVASDEEALERMNDTDYGLTAAVFSTDAARAEKLLAGVHSGTAYWNCCDRVSPRLPWTGRKGSGIGSTLSIIGIRAFLQPKAYHLKGAR